ncbi:MAG: hypothetical protein AAF975_05500, partial [Spirochaetota bacterium]
MLSCAQLRWEQTRDYSGALPPEQLLYLSVRRMDEFPFADLQARFLENEQLQGFVAKRLQWSQLAIGPRGEVFIVNQLVLGSALFAAQMGNLAAWEAIPELSAAYLRRDALQALQMPQSNLLYLSQGLEGEEQVREQREFTRLWRMGAKRSSLPQRFLELQEVQPLVAYSPEVIRLILSPWLQKSFPQALSSFARMSRQFPVSQMLVWVEMREGNAYVLHLQLATGSLLLSKGLEAGFRLFLPSLIMRSEQ